MPNTDLSDFEKTPISPAVPATQSPAENDEDFDDAEDNIELCTNAAATKIERWKNRLLDLSLRNTLLNFGARGASGSLDFITPDAAEFENALSEKNAAFEIFSPDELNFPENVPADEATQQAVSVAAQKALAKKKIAAKPPALRSGKNVPADRVRDRLAKIARTAKNAIAETGANTLFVALGFLSWRCEKRRDKDLRAPIILIPATLEKTKTGTPRWILRALDGDVRLNLTLVELLRQEFGITLPELENVLPEDESGIDTAKVFNIFHKAIAGRDGFSVKENCALGNFSFAKYLMWRDLQDHAEIFARSRIVSHLLDETRKPFATGTPFLRPQEIDSAVPAEKNLCPLPADSSQLSAVFAATQDRNFILVGPPGTGKSQTIANMIANALADGKTVLFVAEKSAALNVVFRRLKKIGLAEFCLELHSDKTDKSAAYAQLGETLELAAAGISGEAENARKKSADNEQKIRETFLRTQKILNGKRKCGLSLADAIAVICGNESAPKLDFHWQNSPAEESENARENRRQSATDLATTFTGTRGSLARASGFISHANWNPQWQRETEKSAKVFLKKIENLREKISAFTETTGLIAPAGTLKSFETLFKRIDTLLPIRGENPSLVLAPDAAKKLAEIRAAATLAENCAMHHSRLSLPYRDDAPNSPELESLLQTWREAEISWFLPKFFKKRKVLRALRLLADSGTPISTEPDARVDLGNLIAIRNCRAEFSQKYSALANAFPSLIKGPDSCGALPRISALEKATNAVSSALAELSDVPEKRDAWQAVFARWLDKKNPDFAVGGNVEKTLVAATSALEELAVARQSLEEIIGNSLAFLAKNSPEKISEFIKEFLADSELWRDVCSWNKAANTAKNRGLETLANAVRDGSVPANESENVFNVNFCRAWAEAIFEQEPELLDSRLDKNILRVKKYREADNALRKANAAAVRARLVANAAHAFDANAANELKLLRHEIGKRRAHLPIRRFLANAPKIQRALKPCLLTSPLSAAQYLEITAEPFDVVIFDEASQISVWDAVGAIARGKNAVIVGDPKQLPPTSFFQKASASENDSPENEIVPEDAESVLDECIACGVPALKLSWHYRSRAESLIAFSNARYYGGELATFPAPRVRDRSLECVFCEDGIYTGGSARTNPAEAKKLVARVVEEISQPDFVYDEFSSIGIVTFNTQQQALIQKLFENEQEKNPAIRKFFSEEEVAEPIFVKNLENVQGDERGVIYFSTTFGPDENGNVAQNFGPINRVGGERRLNVAITRSRAGMRVFTSLRPSDIRTERGGMADLRDFIDFARTGTPPTNPRENAKNNTPAAKNLRGNGIEFAIASKLEERGWKCVTNVGISGIRVDVAVVHPERENEFIAGILCDGATSLNAPTIRDREILREDVLRGLGWTLLRAWSLDRWQTPETCISSLDSALKKILATSRGNAIS